MQERKNRLVKTIEADDYKNDYSNNYNLGARILGSCKNNTEPLTLKVSWTFEKQFTIFIHFFVCGGVR